MALFLLYAVVYNRDMKYKFYVYCPDNKNVINRIINAASTYGAGVYGNYSQVAYITHGDGNWKTEKGARPVEGKVGTITKSRVARVEMTCDAGRAKQIERVIKAVHPWEQVDVEFVRIEGL
jgi:hypothetical protein